MSAYTRPSRRRARLRACRECGATCRPVTNSKRCAQCRSPRFPHCRLYIIACEQCGRTVASGDSRRLFCRDARCRARHSDAVIVGQRQCVLCREMFTVNRRQERGRKQYCGPACLREYRSERMAERMAARRIA